MNMSVSGESFSYAEEEIITRQNGVEIKTIIVPYTFDWSVRLTRRLYMNLKVPLVLNYESPEMLVWNREVILENILDKCKIPRVHWYRSPIEIDDIEPCIIDKIEEHRFFVTTHYQPYFQCLYCSRKIDRAHRRLECNVCHILIHEACVPLVDRCCNAKFSGIHEKDPKAYETTGYLEVVGFGKVFIVLDKYELRVYMIDEIGKDGWWRFNDLLFRSSFARIILEPGRACTRIFKLRLLTELYQHTIMFEAKSVLQKHLWVFEIAKLFSNDVFLKPAPPEVKETLRFGSLIYNSYYSVLKYMCSPINDVVHVRNSVFLVCCDEGIYVCDPNQHAKPVLLIGVADVKKLIYIPPPSLYSYALARLPGNKKSTIIQIHSQYLCYTTTTIPSRDSQILGDEVHLDNRFDIRDLIASSDGRYLVGVRDGGITVLDLNYHGVVRRIRLFTFSPVKSVHFIRNHTIACVSKHVFKFNLAQDSTSKILFNSQMLKSYIVNLQSQFKDSNVYTRVQYVERENSCNEYIFVFGNTVLVCKDAATIYVHSLLFLPEIDIVHVEWTKNNIVRVISREKIAYYYVRSHCEKYQIARTPYEEIKCACTKVFGDCTVEPETTFIGVSDGNSISLSVLYHQKILNTIDLVLNLSTITEIQIPAPQEPPVERPNCSSTFMRSKIKPVASASCVVSEMKRALEIIRRNLFPENKCDETKKKEESIINNTQVKNFVVHQIAHAPVDNSVRSASGNIPIHVCDMTEKLHKSALHITNNPPIKLQSTTKKRISFADKPTIVLYSPTSDSNNQESFVITDQESTNNQCPSSDSNGDQELIKITNRDCNETQTNHAQKETSPKSLDITDGQNRLLDLNNKEPSMKIITEECAELKLVEVSDHFNKYTDEKTQSQLIDAEVQVGCSAYNLIDKSINTENDGIDQVTELIPCNITITHGSEGMTNMTILSKDFEFTMKSDEETEHLKMSGEQLHIEFEWVNKETEDVMEKDAFCVDSEMKNGSIDCKVKRDVSKSIGIVKFKDKTKLEPNTDCEPRASTSCESMDTTNSKWNEALRTYTYDEFQKKRKIKSKKFKPREKSYDHKYPENIDLPIHVINEWRKSSETGYDKK